MTQISKPTIEFINQAIQSLCPGSSYSVIGDDIDIDDNGFLKSVNWDTTNTQDEPLASKILEKIEELKDSYYKNSYRLSREAEYPPIGDQLDALFKAGLFPEEMAAQIQAIKDKYPKG